MTDRNIVEAMRAWADKVESNVAKWKAEKEPISWSQFVHAIREAFPAPVGEKTPYVQARIDLSKPAPSAPKDVVEKLRNPMLVGREISRPGENLILQVGATVTAMKEAADLIERLARQEKAALERAEKAERERDSARILASTKRLDVESAESSLKEAEGLLKWIEENDVYYDKDGGKCDGRFAYKARSLLSRIKERK